MAKEQMKAPFETDPMASFARVARLRTDIKQAERDHDIAKAAALEKKNALNRMNKQLSDLIDAETDPRPNLFSHVQAAAPPQLVAGDWAAIEVGKVVSAHDAKLLVTAGITTLGELSLARAAEGGLEKKGVLKATIKRIETEVQKFLASSAGGSAPKESKPAPKAKAKGKAKSKAKPAAEPAAAGATEAGTEAK